MLKSSEFNSAVPKFTNGNYASNPLDPTNIEEPSAQDYIRGTEPLDTLPAQWWNWLCNQFTSRFNKLNTYVKNIFDELTGFLSLLNITPDGTESDITTGQLKNAFKEDYPAYINSKLELGTTYVKKTQKVNNHALTGDVTVTKSDVGLGNVVNTGDSATPVSGGTTKFTTGGAYTELNKKADKPATATNNDVAILDANGNLKDSGIRISNIKESTRYHLEASSSSASLDKVVCKIETDGTSKGRALVEIDVASRIGNVSVGTFKVIVVVGYSLPPRMFVLGSPAQAYSYFRLTQSDVSQYTWYVECYQEQGSNRQVNLDMTVSSTSNMCTVTKSGLEEQTDTVTSLLDTRDNRVIVENELNLKADLLDLAPAFSTSTSYAVGDYVTYDGNLYRCTTAHSADAWNSSHFTAVTVGNELETLKQTKTESRVIDLVNYTTAQYVAIADVTSWVNDPSNFGGSACFVGTINTRRPYGDGNNQYNVLSAILMVSGSTIDRKVLTVKYLSYDHNASSTLFKPCIFLANNKYYLGFYIYPVDRMFLRLNGIFSKELDNFLSFSNATMYIEGESIKETSSVTQNSRDVFTSGGAYTELAKKVDKTTTVNGHALSGDVTVTKGDVDLGNVVNTGDSATPVSGGTTKFTTGGAYTELNKKFDKTSAGDQVTYSLSGNTLTITSK